MIVAVALWSALGDMLSQPFMRNAFIGGTSIAVASGLVGYFVVLRSQVFTGDALSHVAFTSALAALAFGIDARLGLFVGTVGVALLLGLLGPQARADDVVIGSVFAWVLGLGVLFLSIFTASHSASNGAAGVNVLFGSIFGLTDGQTVLAFAVATAVVMAVVAIGRPLLFASIDQAVAAARGVPVRTLGFVFLALVGVTAAQATQAVGALLLLGLLAAPAGISQRLTGCPYRALVLSAVVAAVSVWIGLTISFFVPKVPPSFAIIAVVAALYAVTLAATRRSRTQSRQVGSPA
jgi:zinc/manganese transport system permease protein